jgi:hypothetical protein
MCGFGDMHMIHILLLIDAHSHVTHKVASHFLESSKLWASM